MLRAIAPTLSFHGARPRQGETAGHRACGDDPSLDEGIRAWMAAGSPRPRPMPMSSSSTNIARPSARRPPQLASLAYDAVSLVALLSQGHALSSLHASRADGSQRFCRRERHLPLQRRTAHRSADWRCWRSRPPASSVVSPAPTTFQSSRELRRFRQSVRAPTSRTRTVRASKPTPDHAVEQQAAGWRRRQAVILRAATPAPSAPRSSRHRGACSSASR